MRISSLRAFFALAVLSISTASASTLAFSSPASAETNVVLRSNVTFQPLNPARGDASPQAGVLWGDLKKDMPTGAVIEFKEGFSSPPHIHNITYRAVVIEGAVHNDDPNATTMWMGPGSFWTQPAGENHITSAISEKGATIFLEILEGPYLVQSPEQAFDNGERPVNIESGNMIWLNANDVSWVEASPGGAQTGAEMAFLWGETGAGQMNGTFLKVPSGGSGFLNGNGAQLHAVQIAGEAELRIADNDGPVALTPGSYFGTQDKTGHELACSTAVDCVFYIRTNGKYTFANP